MRAHLILPEDLVRQIDTTVGKRKRSRFVEEAVREKLRRENLLAALKEAAGALSPDEHPDWTTPEGAAAWVRKYRRGGDERLGRLKPG